MKVLVIDDEINMCNFLSRALKVLGFDVSYTTNPHDFNTLYSDEIDIIILDLFMPSIDGVELIREIASSPYCSALILISAFSSNLLYSVQKLSEEQGINVLGVLSKPFTIEELQSLLNKYEAKPYQHHHSKKTFPFSISIDEIKIALAKKQFFLEFQPQFKISTGKICGCEALIRWQHPEKGLISPQQFIPLIEKHDELIQTLTVFVIEEAIKQLSIWNKAGLMTRMSINISAKMLLNISFPEWLENKIQNFNILPNQLVMEMTETAFSNDVIKSLDILTRLRLKGFKLSIDDFGTGYSSMLQLIRIPFTELKIDQEFIKNLNTNKESFTIAKAATALAHELEMTVIAEGIELEEHIHTLAGINCDEGQGFFIAPPMNKSNFETWVKSQYQSSIHYPIQKKP